MKTLCFSLGLLLVACCCNAMLEGAKFAAPVKCCWKFKDGPFPSKLVADMYKTHSSCPRKAFIVETVKGRQICFSQTSNWAVKFFSQRMNSEGSGWQN